MVDEPEVTDPEPLFYKFKVAWYIGFGKYKGKRMTGEQGLPSPYLRWIITNPDLIPEISDALRHSIAGTLRRRARWEEDEPKHDPECSCVYCESGGIKFEQ